MVGRAGADIPAHGSAAAATGQEACPPRESDSKVVRIPVDRLRLPKSLRQPPRDRQPLKSRDASKRSMDFPALPPLRQTT